MHTRTTVDDVGAWGRVVTTEHSSAAAPLCYQQTLCSSSPQPAHTPRSTATLLSCWASQRRRQGSSLESFVRQQGNKGSHRQQPVAQFWPRQSRPTDITFGINISSVGWTSAVVADIRTARSEPTPTFGCSSAAPRSQSSSTPQRSDTPQTSLRRRCTAWHSLITDGPLIVGCDFVRQPL